MARIGLKTAIGVEDNDSLNALSEVRPTGMIIKHSFGIAVADVPVVRPGIPPVG